MDLFVELAEIVDEAEGIDYPNLLYVHGQIPNDAPEKLFIEKEGKKLPAQAKDYTHVRWSLISPLKAGEKGSVQYVVQVK